MLEQLAPYFVSFDKLLVAFSGGVDSSFLLAVAARFLGRERVAGLTALSPTLPRHEREACQRIAEELGVALHLVPSHELANPLFAQNGPDRCFHCKSALFKTCREWLASQPDGPRWSLAYGANVDDLAEHRPGMEAARLAGIQAPLLAAKLGKREIRAFSQQLGLSTADKPAFACLSSRFPTFTVITPERLRQVEAAEQVLRTLGYRQFRVRYHGETARIELEPTILALLSGERTQEIVELVTATGFSQVVIDPQGYRSGGANLG